jgi:hypothetical protein
MAFAVGIAVVGIVGDRPNSAAVVVNADDPRVGYTPYDTLQEHR